MAINYEAREWNDGESGGTPITAESLNRIEDALSRACGAIDGLTGEGGDVSIGTSAIKDGAVTAEKLASGAVTADSVSGLPSKLQEVLAAAGTWNSVDFTYGAKVAEASNYNRVMYNPALKLINFNVQVTVSQNMTYEQDPIIKISLKPSVNILRALTQLYDGTSVDTAYASRPLLTTIDTEGNVMPSRSVEKGKRLWINTTIPTSVWGGSFFTTAAA